MDSFDSSQETPPIAAPGGDHNRRWLTPVFYFIIVLIWPALAFWRTPSDPLDFAWQIESNRLGTYGASAIFLWSMFALVWLIQRLDGRRLPQLGFTVPRWRDFTWGIAFLVIAYPILGLFAWTLELLGLAIPEMVIRALLPVTMPEQAAWVGISFTAAVAEETVFRGYLLVRGEEILRSRRLAVVLSALTFGIGHYYQGWGGVVLISAYGLMFTWLRFRTGSLWACIVAHALQDILAVYFASLQR